MVLPLIHFIISISDRRINISISDRRINSFISISDRRINKKIKSIENVSSIINNLNPVQFDYIQTKNSSTGFIAQEVYYVYPRAVHIDIEHIPNIMEQATINGNVVTFENKCNITVNANNSIRICNDSNYINGNEYLITEVIDKNTFVINKNDFKSNDGSFGGSKIGPPKTGKKLGKFPNFP
jgi:hypothetical protein